MRNAWEGTARVVGMLATTLIAGCSPGVTTPTFPSLHLPAVDRVDGPSSLASPSVPISGHLYRPAGERRAPAVVVLHGGHGIGEYALGWASWLGSQGYVALAVDSLGSRAPGEPRIWGGRRGVSLNEMAADAYGAMAYLRTLPFVDSDRIAVMGWSQGGAAAFIAVNPAGRPALAHGGSGFRAAIGVYPICESLSPSTSVPVLLLLGDDDPYTPRCLQDAAAMQRERKPVTAKTYAGAKHGFDVPASPMYDGAATASARSHVRDFLRDSLAPR